MPSMLADLCRPWLRELALTACVVACVALSVSACEPRRQRRPIEMAPIGTVPVVVRTVEEPDGGTTTTPNSGTAPSARESACAGAELEATEETLRQCEAPTPRASDLPPGLRDRLEVRVSASASSVGPGGRVELTVTLKNRSSEPLPLYFAGDPTPRFEVEALDGKGRRADLPAGRPPKPQAPLGPRDVRAARLTLSPGGLLRVKVPWDAVKTRWVTDKVKGGGDRGLPRAPSGPLAPGKYTLRVALPLLGASDKSELDLPKVVVEVGG
jgi:hypothetical protein